jgi:hypothetical protein
VIDYDSPEWGGGGDFLKLDEEGDKFWGELVGYTTRFFEADPDKKDSKDRTCPVLVIRIDDKDLEYTVTHADLRAQLKKAKPQPGVMLGIKRGRQVGKVITYDVVIRAKQTGETVMATVEPTAVMGGDNGEFPF